MIKYGSHCKKKITGFALQKDWESKEMVLVIMQIKT